MEAVKERAQKHAIHGFSQFELTTAIVKNLKQFNLTPTAKLVLVLLTTHYNQEKNGAVVFPSIPYIAETLGIGLTATKQAIKDLITEGLIIKSKRDKVSGNYNKYLLTLKVQNTTSERSGNELLEQSETDRFMRTNNKEKITNKPDEGKNNQILLSYAERMGANNKVAYMNRLKANGSANQILDEYKQMEINKRVMEKRTQQVIQERQLAAQTAVPPTQSWLELKTKLFKLQ